MFKKKNKLIALFMVLILVTGMISYASAEEATPYADEIFDFATINLKSTRKVVYTASTYGYYNISIASCFLQKKVDGEWQWVCSLPKPSSASNVAAYSREMDYYSYIGSGTYRVGASFNASGHLIIRYSNSRTF